jgi:hypothetical protein
MTTARMPVMKPLIRRDTMKTAYIKRANGINGQDGYFQLLRVEPAFGTTVVEKEGIESVCRGHGYNNGYRIRPAHSECVDFAVKGGEWIAVLREMDDRAGHEDGSRVEVRGTTQGGTGWAFDGLEFESLKDLIGYLITAD